MQYGFHIVSGPARSGKTTFIRSRLIEAPVGQVFVSTLTPLEYADLPVQVGTDLADPIVGTTIMDAATREPAKINIVVVEDSQRKFLNSTICDQFFQASRSLRLAVIVIVQSMADVPPKWRRRAVSARLFRPSADDIQKLSVDFVASSAHGTRIYGRSRHQ
ncbi:MAG: hypothetical protein WC700_04235 [Gemmatimonadaceae bacterium]|jgi:hypothetical protein